MLVDALKKYKWILLIQFLLFLLLLAGCFQDEKLVYHVENIHMGNDASSSYSGEFFGVSPGVYQVRVSMSELQSDGLYVGAFCKAGSFRTFRCNGANIYAGQKYLDFEIYVLEYNDTAYVKCDLGGTQAEIGKIEVYWTNMGWRISLLLYSLMCMMVNCLLVLRYGVTRGIVKKDTQFVLGGLALSVLISFFPYFTDYFSDAADISFHWLRIEGLKETLLQGNQFPVRVQSNWLYDHGYAVSLFYGDTFLLIPALFRILGFSLMTSYKMFVFGVMTATAFISYYAIQSCIQNKYAALIGSIIYVLSPYRIYNVYNRGAVGEYLAMTFMPLVICGIYRLYTEEVNTQNYKNAKIPLIIGMSCVLQSHLLSCEMLVVGILFVCMVCWKKTFRKQTFTQLVYVAVICLLINAWFWLPLVCMLGNDRYHLSDVISQNIQDMGTWFAELFQLYPNKGTWQEGMYMAEPFQIGVVSLLMLIAAFIVIAIKSAYQYKKKVNFYEKDLFLWGSLIILAWFMSTRYFPWNFLEKIPGIKILVTALQFPTRLFTLVSAFAAFFAAFFYLWMREETNNILVNKEVANVLIKSILSILLVLAFGSALYHVNDIAYLNHPIWLYNAENIGTIRVVNGEYMLKGTTVGEYSYHAPVGEGGLEWSEYRKNGTSVELHVQNQTGEMLGLELPLTGYKGYVIKCSEAGENNPYISNIRGAHGDLRIIVPPGYAGNLIISYKGGNLFRVAELISVFSLGALLVIWRMGEKRDGTKNISYHY